MRILFFIVTLLLALEAPAQVAFFRQPPQDAGSGTNAVWTGLVGYWKCEEVSGTLLDSSPSGKDFTANNSPLTGTGIIDNARTLVSATSQYFSLADDSAFSPSTAFTFSFWVYKSDTTAAGRGVFSKYAASSKTQYYIGAGSSLSGTGPLVAIPATSTENFATYGYVANVYPSINTWYHTVVVYDGSLSGNANRLKIYVNSVLQTLTFAGTIPASLQTTDVPIQIGGNTASSVYMNGRLDEMSWFPGVAKDQTAVNTIYNGGVGRQYPN